MNRWQALTDIVKAFIDSGSPGYGLATVLIFGIPFAASAIMLAFKLLH